MTDSLKEYVEKQSEFLLKTADLEYALLNLSGEVGELLGLFAKHRLKGRSFDELLKLVHSPEFQSDEELRKKLIGELGDVFFFSILCIIRCGFTPEFIAQQNIDKLTERLKNNTIIGNGDIERTKL